MMINKTKNNEQNSFRISPSQISRFFSETHKWYLDQVLGEEGFQGSTSTYLGTALHSCIEMCINKKKVDWSIIESFIENIKQFDIDKNIILEQVYPMYNAVESFVIENLPLHSELYIQQEILTGIYAGGTIDAIKGPLIYYYKDPLYNVWKKTTREYYEEVKHTLEVKVESSKPVEIIDWKTTSQKTLPTSFIKQYWLQQMTYAWLLKQKNIEVKNINLVFISRQDINRISEKTHKPLKDYPSQISVVTEKVTSDNLAIIEGILKLIAESVLTFKKYPEFRHLLAQDYRLKEYKLKLLDKNKE